MASATRHYRLLAIDDNDVDQCRYRQLLARPAGGSCDVEYCSSGAHGLRALRDHAPDCVLLDLNLPDMTGLDFLREASAGGELPCAFVVVTGPGNELLAVEAMKCGALDCLSKDQLNASNLWRAMSTSVARSELSRQLAASLRELTAANAALEQEAATREAAETELRAAKDAAEHANRAKTRFVAMVTHELRTPLNGILGYAQLLRLEGGLSTKQETRVAAMMQAGRHLLDMIEHVLDFASIETGRMQLHPVPVSVRDLGEECMAFIGPLADEHALTLRMVSAHDVPRQIAVDPARLRQVLLNLLGNAVKYTERGSVELRLLPGAAPGGLRIEVADTGPGIREADREALFQDFERLGAAPTVEGAGLGLAIAWRIVKLMNSTLGYLPNAGGGSVFWLELQTAAAAETAPAAAERPPLRVPAKGHRILVVDDIAMNRDVIGAFLCAAGHSVQLAENGHDAVRMASREAFDLILMDVRMPDMDGLEATRRIRALPAPFGATPVLALTAYSFGDQIAKYRDAGMNGHIAKPVDYAALINAIEDAVARVPSRWLNDTSPPPDIDPAEGDQSPLRLDRSLFDQMVSFLPKHEAIEHLNALRERVRQMIGLLDSGAPASRQTEMAHGLGSAAGLFGFIALSIASRNFERAVAGDMPAAERLTQHLRNEASATLAAVDTLIRDNRMQKA